MLLCSTCCSPKLLDGESRLMSAEDASALAACAVPARNSLSSWRLLYCTHRDGISLNTMYRKAAGKSSTILLVKDTGAVG